MKRIFISNLKRKKRTLSFFHFLQYEKGEKNERHVFIGLLIKNSKLRINNRFLLGFYQVMIHIKNKV
jgi:hypothetical protein